MPLFTQSYNISWLSQYVKNFFQLLSVGNKYHKTRERGKKLPIQAPGGNQNDPRQEGAT